MERITVDIYTDEYTGRSIFFEMWLMSKLKKAGIPIVGTFKFKGVKDGVFGKMTHCENPNMVRYFWKPEGSAES